MTKYEITIELPNGDWRWLRVTAIGFHDLCEQALAYAAGISGARVHHVQKLAP